METKLIVDEDGRMTAVCPHCGTLHEVAEDDYNDSAWDGTPEYRVYCDVCHLGFYASENFK